MIVRVHGGARRDMIQAGRWYERATPGLGARFRAAVENALRAAAEDPRAGAPYLLGTRRRLLDRFPYGLVHVERGTTLWIVAVAHHRRRPGYWARRLPPV